MKSVVAFVLIIGSAGLSTAQKNDSLLKRIPKDTGITVNSDAIYTRPFITLGRTSTAVGGYLEGNTNYFSTDGVSEGFSMEMRRFNIFLYSAIARKIKFLSELEFERGTEEISLETALIDFEVAPAFNFRTGILLAPIGAFNQNHDGPKWEFVERPLVATEIIPSTLSEIGFGVHGKFYGDNKVLSYEAYLVNGLGDGVILNSQGRTFLQAGKNPEMFGEDNNGIPMMTGKIAFRHRKIAEAGLSYYGGVYNSYRAEGVTVDKKRRLSIAALDVNTTIKKAAITAEFAYNTIDVPGSAGQFFGKKQWGGYMDFVYPVLKKTILKYENTVLNLNLRLEAIDYNTGVFTETGTKIYDEVKAIVPGISLRPAANTVIRFNYRYHWTRDLLGNPVIRTAGFQFGAASYF